MGQEEGGIPGCCRMQTGRNRGGEQRGEKGGREDDNLDKMESDGVHGNSIVTFIPTLNTQQSRSHVACKGLCIGCFPTTPP